ncbi:unnamed protein product [Diamesa hyperborea]
MENKTIENIAICSAVIGAFILIAYIIKKFDKIVLKWKDISATFGMNSTTESETETANKSPKEVKKEAKTESKDSEDSEDLKLIPIGKKTNKKSDSEPGTSTKDVKPKLDVESPSPSNITNFANIKEDHKGMQTNNETIYADDFRVTKDARINNVGNIETISQGDKRKLEILSTDDTITRKNIMNLKAFLKERSVPVYIAVAVVAIGVIFLANNYDKIGLAYNNIKATFENEPNKIQKVGNFEEINNEEQIDRDSEYSDNFKVPAGTPVSDCLNIKRTNNKKVEGGKTVVKRDIDLTVKV